MTLALAAECDVRSCLNTLQFVATRAGRVRASDLHTASVGAKDLTKGAFDVWGRLFMHTPVRRSCGIAKLHRSMLIEKHTRT